jgi:zinc transporter, ZIP family
LLAGIGLLAGAAVFVLADTLLDRHIEGAGSSVSGYVILAAVILDGIPENAALGISLQTSGPEALALLVGVFASNLPEALGGAVSMKDQGRTSGFAIVVWTVTAVVLAAAVVAGNAVLSGVSEESITILLAFAGGAVLASLADTLMPDAYR